MMSCNYFLSVTIYVLYVYVQFSCCWSSVGLELYPPVDCSLNNIFGHVTSAKASPYSHNTTMMGGARFMRECPFSLEKNCVGVPNFLGLQNRACDTNHWMSTKIIYPPLESTHVRVRRCSLLLAIGVEMAERNTACSTNDTEQGQTMRRDLHCLRMRNMNVRMT